jgi:hypothetical protein
MGYEGKCLYPWPSGSVAMSATHARLSANFALASFALEQGFAA